MKAQVLVPTNEENANNVRNQIVEIFRQLFTQWHGGRNSKAVNLTLLMRKIKALDEQSIYVHLAAAILESTKICRGAYTLAAKWHNVFECYLEKAQKMLPQANEEEKQAYENVKKRLEEIAANESDEGDY